MKTCSVVEYYPCDISEKMASVDVKLKRVNKIYKEGEVVSGFVVIQTKTELPHLGINLSVDGTVNLQLSSKSVGLFEAFYNSLKPIQLLNYNLDLAKAGKIPPGKTEIPFEIPLRPRANRQLYETYHGVFVNIQYMIKMDMKRPLLNKDLQKLCEFIVEYHKDHEERGKPKPVTFNIIPGSLQNVREQQNIPKFRIKGRLDSTHCCISDPFTGELVVEHSDAAIKSIELQLVRMETCGCAEGYAKEATEIQNIQIGEGDVCRGLVLPIYMVFPRLFTCPTLATTNFKVEFEINIVVVFKDDHLVTENFPIKLYRF